MGKRRGPVRAAARWPTKEAADLARSVEKAGGHAMRTARGHMKVTGPGGVAFVATKLGGSGGRTLVNTMATIARKTGLVLHA